MATQQIWYISNRISGTRFFDHFWMGRQMGGAVIYYFTSLHHMREYCIEKYQNPEGSPIFYDHCALAHSNERGNPEMVPN